MHSIHIITEEKVKEKLQEVIASYEENVEVFLLKDKLNLGCLRSEGLPFEECRSAFFRLISDNPNFPEIADLSGLLAISTRLTNGEDSRICFWMGDNATDVCTYYWLLHFLKKHSGKLDVIKISGLPFLDEDNHLFYPERLEQLPNKELAKALKLRRSITISEWELEQDEWKQLLADNAGIRVLAQDKKLIGCPIEYYDERLINCCNKPLQRLSIIIQHAAKELRYQVAIPFLQYRLNILNEKGVIIIHQNKVEPVVVETSEDAGQG